MLLSTRVLAPRGRLLTTWGLIKANSMDSPYEICGYVKPSKIDFTASKNQLSPQRKDLEAELRLEIACYALQKNLAI